MNFLINLKNIPTFWYNKKIYLYLLITKQLKIKKYKNKNKK